MPHHSSQRRAVGQPPPYTNSPGGQRQQVPSSDPPVAAAPYSYRPPPAPHSSQHMMRMAPPPSVPGWTAPMKQPAVLLSQQVHRVPSASVLEEKKDDDQGDHQHDAANMTPQQKYRQYITQQFSFESSPHEVAAASVLLLAASASASTPEDTHTMDESSMPLKKRKKVADILRKHSSTNNISPMSHSSVSKHEESPTILHGSGSSRTPSYELKDTPPSSATANKSSTATNNMTAVITHSQTPKEATVIRFESGTTCSQKIANFPSWLHTLLTESPFSGSVLSWLPHGKAWKIVRWDALRTQVLPTASLSMPQLNVDAFLAQLAGWGFAEITDGPDAGAYSHKLFRRSLPQLANEMVFQEEGYKNDDTHAARSILQVPSLASSSNEGTPEDVKMQPLLGHSPIQASPHHHWQQAPPQYIPGGVVAPPPPLPAGVPTMATPEMSRAHRQPWQYYDAWKVATNSAHNSPTTQPYQQQRPAYSPVRSTIRSGRGAARLPVAVRQQQQAPEKSIATPPQPPRTVVSSGGIPQVSAATTSSFPVSNRGRGKAAASRRVSLGGTQQTPVPGDTTVVAATAPASAATAVKPKFADPTASERAAAAALTSITATMGAAASTTPTSPLRSVLKRKLPLTNAAPAIDRAASASAESSTSEESSTSSDTEVAAI